MEKGNIWFKEVERLLKKEKPFEIPIQNYKPSAVGVPLSVMKGKLCITLIKRSMKVNHPGQVGFPGGQYEIKDQNFYNTVLREVEEELGIRKELIYLLGQLSDQITPSGYWIRPFVILIPGNLKFNPKDRIEVEEIISIPVLELQKTSGQWGTEYFFKKLRIWGVTARIMDELFKKIGLNF